MRALDDPLQALGLQVQVHSALRNSELALGTLSRPNKAGSCVLLQLLWRHALAAAQRTRQQHCGALCGLVLPLAAPEHQLGAQGALGAPQGALELQVPLKRLPKHWLAPTLVGALSWLHGALLGVFWELWAQP